MQMDMLLFPIHKPRHWSLLVRKLFKNIIMIHFVLPIPRLYFLHRYSDEDAVNWIWWDMFLPWFHDYVSCHL